MVARIDFGGVEVKSGGGKPFKDNSKVLAETTKFELTDSQAGNAMIVVHYKVTDENAEDVDGGQDYYKTMRDNLVFTANAAKMVKIKLKGLGYPVDDLVIEGRDDLEELVGELKDNYLEKEVILVTENREWNDKVSSQVRFVNEVN